MVQNAHFGLKYELKHFTTPYMQLPPPAVFHDKAKRTQKGDLLVKNQPVFKEQKTSSSP